MTGITYAKAGGPPDNYYCYDVVDLDTGAKRQNVREINTEEGWLIEYFKDDAGQFANDGENLLTRRIEGRFKLVERGAAPTVKIDGPLIVLS